MAHAVINSVAEGIIPKGKAAELLILVTAFVHWEAKSKHEVYENDYTATKKAILRAFEGEPDIDEILALKDSAKHFFYPSSEDEEHRLDG